MFDFFNDESIATLGAARTKPLGNRVDPKSKFIETTKFNIEQIEAGETTTHWVKTQRDGTVIVTLRNGTRVLNNKKPQFVCKDKEAAVKYLTAAHQAAEAGKFDELFRLQTHRGV